ncbi:hypothetical protein NC652_016567 [Populus alba x Populus x berolinensis]|nr:hypothetical protein NC652_016567 [Populus alba x Populus x berolinensis]
MTVFLKQILPTALTPSNWWQKWCYVAHSLTPQILESSFVRCAYISPTSQRDKYCQQFCQKQTTTATLLQNSMAKEVSGSRSWIEVAPAPIIYPRKPSNAPRLEPIAEEGHEEQDEDSQAFQKD